MIASTYTLRQTVGILCLSALALSTQAATSDQLIQVTGTIAEGCVFRNSSVPLTATMNGQGRALAPSFVLEVDCTSAIPFSLTPAADVVSASSSEGEAFTVKSVNTVTSETLTTVAPLSVNGIKGNNQVFMGFKIEGSGPDKGLGKIFKKAGTLVATYNFKLTY